MDPYNPLPPRLYAERALGKAATPEQLDELFALYAAAHPVVRHDTIGTGAILTGKAELAGASVCFVKILGGNPAAGGTGVLLASGRAICSPFDQYNRRRGLTIAFGRALKQLREEVQS